MLRLSDKCTTVHAWQVLHVFTSVRTDLFERLHYTLQLVERWLYCIFCEIWFTWILAQRGLWVQVHRRCVVVRDAGLGREIRDLYFYLLANVWSWHYFDIVRCFDDWLTFFSYFLYVLLAFHVLRRRFEVRLRRPIPIRSSRTAFIERDNRFSNMMIIGIVA